MQRSKVITKLVKSCLDDERVLVLESRLVDAPKSVILTRLADERRKFSQDLERLNGRNGRGARGTYMALARELGGALWTRLLGRNAGDAIAACRSSQRRTEARYDRALALQWPAELRAVLIAQYDRIHSSRRELAEIEY